MISKLKKVFLMVAGKAVETFGMELEEHQQLILAAAEILIEIYMAESALIKAEKVADMTSVAAAKGQIAMAKLNLSHAVNIIVEKGKEAIVYFSEGDEQRMMLMGLKRFTKYTNLPNVIALRNEISAILIEENKYCF
jgi:alkylation response protein AidB-like acyl-CoA dehydrogenase